MVWHKMMYGYIHHHNVILYTVNSCCTSNHDGKIRACLSNGNPQVAYLAKKHGICISHEATCPIPKQQNWLQKLWDTWNHPARGLLCFEIQAKTIKKSTTEVRQTWCRKNKSDALYSWIFLGEAPSRTACKQCLHSTVCDETYLGCTMAVSQNEPKKN